MERWGGNNGGNSPTIRTVESTDKRVKMGERKVPFSEEKDAKRDGGGECIIRMVQWRVFREEGG